jgi:hypothetical protein
MRYYRLIIVVSTLAASTIAALIVMQFQTVGVVNGGNIAHQTIRHDLFNRQSSTAQWYVAPEGSPAGNGTIDSPWDLATALAQGPNGTEVKPGNTIWLRGGRYAGNFFSDLSGTAEAPIIVRQYPGERAILDKNAAAASIGGLKVRGCYTWYWGFEITNSYPDRNRLAPSGDLDTWRGSGVNIYGPNNKFINLVLHDNGHAFGLWDEDGGTEIYGCIVYYNGNNKKEHGLYAHNDTGTQLIAENVIFDGAGYGIHVYANNPEASLSGFQIEGNAVFNNGALTLDDQVADQILVGGVEGAPAERIVLRENYVYTPIEAATNKNRGVRLGYEDRDNRDVKLLGNYIVSKVPLKVQWWRSVESTGNTIYSQGTSVEDKTPSGGGPFNFQWNSNTYLSGRRGGPVFLFDDGTYDFAGWQRATGTDMTSQVVQTPSLRPSGVRVFVRANKYEEGRANIVVFNWDLQAQISVNVSAVLKIGTRYEVRDVQNYFGAPVASGTYTGSPILLPLNLTQVAQPIGNVERIPAHTKPEFGVYVLLPSNSGNSSNAIVRVR